MLRANRMMRKLSFVFGHSSFVRTTNYQPRTTNYELPTTNYELRTTNYQPRTTRAQGLPISVIVIAVLALLVLFVVSYMVVQKVGLFGKGTGEQTSAKCEAPNRVAPLGTSCELVIGVFENVGTDQICCKGEA